MARIYKYRWDIYLDNTKIQQYNFMLEDCWTNCDPNFSRYGCNCQKMRDIPYIPKNVGQRNVYLGGANAPGKYKYHEVDLKNIQIYQIEDLTPF